MRGLGGIAVAVVFTACTSSPAPDAAGSPDGPAARDAPGADGASDAARLPDAAGLPDAGGSSDAGGATSACPAGVAPAIADCLSGPEFADCGGTGGPRLACRERSCTWFTTSCVADGYVASDCPPAEVCCHSGWPYSSGPSSWDSYLWWFLWGYGTHPWDATRGMAVNIAIDPSLTRASAPTITCTPDAVLGNTVCDPRNDPTPRRPIVSDMISFSIGDEYFPAGWYAFIDIDPKRLTARFCTFNYTDFIVYTCPYWDSTCATGGTLTLPKLPATAEELGQLPYRLDVQTSHQRIQVAF